MKLYLNFHSVWKPIEVYGSCSYQQSILVGHHTSQTFIVRHVLSQTKINTQLRYHKYIVAYRISHSIRLQLNVVAFWGRTKIMSNPQNQRS